jgi:hypothetical protein
MELDISSHQPPFPSLGDIQFLIKEEKMQQKLKPLQADIPDGLVAEVSTLYDLGLEPYEVDYILSQKQRMRI